MAPDSMTTLSPPVMASYFLSALTAFDSGGASRICEPRRYRLLS